MGDVIAINDCNGNVFAQYVYDEWGKCISILPAIEGNETIANANPLRYRGYYYDNETGYYYLQSRYYDPSICRFINSDIAEISQMSKDIPVGTNLFAYCNNDCVNILDEFGTIAKIDAAIAIVMFVVYYIAIEKLKVNSDYVFESKRILIDSKGNYIVKIVYYKSKKHKKSFVLSLGDKNSWDKEANINYRLNTDFVNNQAKYIQSEYNKGASTSLTNSGPDILGINIASATLAMHLISQGIKANKIRSYYNKVWGKKKIVAGKSSNYYLFNITKGGKKLNGWYAYNYTNGQVKIL